MKATTATRDSLRAHALRHAGAWEDHPWDEDVAKLGTKVFVFFGRPGPELFVGVKLDRSLLFARAQGFVRRFGYGLDASGWVAARFAEGEDVPVALLRSWIDESYEAIATWVLPKKGTSKRARKTPAARRR